MDGVLTARGMMSDVLAVCGGFLFMRKDLERVAPMLGGDIFQLHIKVIITI